LQGLQAIWSLPTEGYSWAAAGYMGAIASGQTTCGLLIGSGVAIGLRCGQGKKGIPEKNETERNRAIGAVGHLYQEFLKEFGSSDCRTLIQCDFSDPNDRGRYIQDKVWKETCDVFLQFVMNKCADMAASGRI